MDFPEEPCKSCWMNLWRNSRRNFRCNLWLNYLNDSLNKFSRDSPEEYLNILGGISEVSQEFLEFSEESPNETSERILG